MKDLSGEGALDYDKALQRTNSLDGMKEVKAAIAAIVFILQNAARFNVNEQKLSIELQQLGLPKESCESLSRSYKDAKPQLVQQCKSQTLKLPQLERLKWRVDFVLASSKLKEVNDPSVEMALELSDPLSVQKKRTEVFEMSADKFRSLYQDLKAARDIMKTLVEQQ